MVRLRRGEEEKTTRALQSSSYMVGSEMPSKTDGSNNRDLGVWLKTIMIEVENGQPIGHIWHTDLLHLVSSILKKIWAKIYKWRTYTDNSFLNGFSQKNIRQQFHMATLGQWTLSLHLSSSLPGFYSLPPPPTPSHLPTWARICCQLWLCCFPNHVHVNRGKATDG